jgi:hypothetical protein
MQGEKKLKSHLEAASLIMNAFFGDVNEILAADDMDNVDNVSSDGPAPSDKSCKYVMGCQNSLGRSFLPFIFENITTLQGLGSEPVMLLFSFIFSSPLLSHSGYQ